MEVKTYRKSSSFGVNNVNASGFIYHSGGLIIQSLHATQTGQS